MKKKRNSDYIYLVLGVVFFLYFMIEDPDKSTQSAEKNQNIHTMSTVGLFGGMN